MAKLIKRGSREEGATPENTSRPQVGAVNQGKVISGRRYDAKADADSIRLRAEQESVEILNSARAEAERIVAAAAEEIEALRSQAQEQGYSEGREQGAQQLSEMVAESSRRLSQIEEQIVPQLKFLALSIARKILGRELEFHPDAVVDVVKQALAEKARQRREIFLRVHPDDLEEIRERKTELLEILSRCREIGLREDPEVARYGVIIETDAGIIDAQLETQLAVFERVLKDTP